MTSNFGGFVAGAELEPDVDGPEGAVEELDVEAAAEGGVPMENEVVRVWPLPFEVAAGTDPNDFIPSPLIVGTAAGEEEIGADASSIDPKVTDEPSDR